MSWCMPTYRDSWWTVRCRWITLVCNNDIIIIIIKIWAAHSEDLSYDICRGFSWSLLPQSIMAENKVFTWLSTVWFVSTLTVWRGYGIGLATGKVRGPVPQLHVMTAGNLFTHTCASVAKQDHLVPAKGRWCSMPGKVTVGLALHWPCVTDSVVYPPTGSMARERKMSKQHLYLYLIILHEYVKQISWNYVGR